MLRNVFRLAAVAVAGGWLAVGTAAAQTPGCATGNCAPAGGCATGNCPNATCGPNGLFGHGIIGKKPPCGVCDIKSYPLSDKRYIRQFCQPTICPGSCYGHFQTKWKSWDEACPQWQNGDPAAAAMSGQPAAPAPATAPAPAPAPMPVTPPTTPMPIPQEKPKERTGAPLPGLPSIPQASLPQTRVGRF